MPAIPYEEHYSYRPTLPPQTKAAPGQVSLLTPELAAQVDDLALARHVVPACCERAEAAGQSWDGKCAKHKGSPAERAEHRRWERKAAATMAAQQLGQATDHAPVVGYFEAAQRDSRGGRPPMVEHVEVI
jgi:hypothetical protein